MLQEEVEILVDCFRTWKMEFNDEKCKIIGRSKLGRTVITMIRKSGERVELEETNFKRELVTTLRYATWTKLRVKDGESRIDNRERWAGKGVT